MQHGVAATSRASDGSSAVLFFYEIHLCKFSGAEDALAAEASAHLDAIPHGLPVAERGVMSVKQVVFFFLKDGVRLDYTGLISFGDNISAVGIRSWFRTLRVSDIYCIVPLLLAVEDCFGDLVIDTENSIVNVGREYLKNLFNDFRFLFVVSFVGHHKNIVE